MKIFTVTQLTLTIKTILENQIGSVSVKGEISGLKIQSSGHIYFTLKDSESQVSAVLFKGFAKNLSKMPKDGDFVTITGELSVYSPRGTYQIIVQSLEFQGVGALLAKLHETKLRLQNLGYFDASHKKPLPIFPKVIGIVTSPTGAVIQDVVHILKRRHSGFHLLLAPVKVQGEGAKEEIAEAIYFLNRHNLADVLIVGRGGGSFEDLYAFNEELVVQAIFDSKIPVISAVGHETDVTLSDFVADKRAPTPSAAAELVIFEKTEKMAFLSQARKRIQQQTNSMMFHLKNALTSTRKHPYLSSPYLLLSKHLQALDDSKQRLSSLIQTSLQDKKKSLLSFSKQIRYLEPSNQIQKTKERCNQLSKRANFSFKQSLEIKKQRLSQVAAHLNSINPKNLLTKGYCILFSENTHSVILSRKELVPEQNLTLLMHDGQVNMTVKDIPYD